MLLQGTEWLHGAVCGGGQAIGWIEQYQSYSDAMEIGFAALRLMREKELTKAESLLSTFLEETAATPGERPEMRAMINRYRYGIESYYCYCRKNYEGASLLLGRAEEAVCQAVNQTKDLMVLAIDCQEFCLHRARIARNQARWPEMYALITQARDMMDSKIPLCSFEGGKQLFWSDLEDCLNAFENPDASARKVIDALTNRTQRQKAFDGYVRGMLLTLASGTRYA